MIFSSKNITYYILTLSAIVVASYFANRFRQNFEPNDEYELIRKYLLNDSPLYGYNRTKLWIHSKYEINARKWKDFGSRNSTDLNQPYLHYTIKSIINHCSDDFNICLIDDDSFSKLLPSWDIDLSIVAEPMKSHFRELGMCQLVYYYGGMVVPNSFVCMKNLKPVFEEGTASGRPFVCETNNRTLNTMSQKRRLLFVPDLYFMGAQKNDPVLLELIEELKRRNSSQHISSESDFRGDMAEWCLSAIRHERMNLLGGELVGVKTQSKKAVLLDNLMEEEFLDFSPSMVGVYIPADEILLRNKYQWFAVLPPEQLLTSNIIIAKYLMASNVDSSRDIKTRKERSVVAL